VAVGQVTTQVTRDPVLRGAPARLASLVPDIRLVYLIRNPIERIRSHYLMLVSGAAEKLPFERAVFADPSYLATSMYAHQIEQHLNFFDRDQLLLVRSEDLRAEPLPTLNRILGFIGLEPYVDDTGLDIELNRSSGLLEDRALFRAARRVPGYGRVARWAPQSLHRLTRSARRRPIKPERALISEDLRGRLEDHLRDDVTKLRRYLGEDFDGWGIA
jgi:hypothetical protein